MATNYSWLLLDIAHMMIIGLLDYWMIIGYYSSIISTNSYGDYTYKCYDNVGRHCLISPPKKTVSRQFMLRATAPIVPVTPC